jgi:hypothetical protein
MVINSTLSFPKFRSISRSFSSLQSRGFILFCFFPLNLSITEKTLFVDLHIWCIKITTVELLHLLLTWLHLFCITTKAHSYKPRVSTSEGTLNGALCQGSQPPWHAKAHWGPSGKPKLSNPNTIFNSIAVIWLKYC